MFPGGFFPKTYFAGTYFNPADGSGPILGGDDPFIPTFRPRRR